jgi:hypothetical protein
VSGLQKVVANPKRPWFRFHLLTAVVMMFAAGVFIWINTRPRSAIRGTGTYYADEQPTQPATGIMFSEAGWPWVFCSGEEECYRLPDEWYAENASIKYAGPLPMPYAVWEALQSSIKVNQSGWYDAQAIRLADASRQNFFVQRPFKNFSPRGILLDLGTLLVILAVVAALSEAILRRRRLHD